MDRDPARILIVDQDRQNGEFLDEQFTKEGCKTAWHADPRQALQALRRDFFQVAIVDVQFSGMSGIEFFLKLREKDPDLGIIVLTAFPTSDTAMTTLKAGASDYLRKPYRFDDVKAVVNRLLSEKGYFLASEQIINQRIGQRIKEFRTQKHWTITKLAAQTRLSKSLISQIENAKNSASLFSLTKIARSLNVKVTDLVQDL